MSLGVRGWGGGNSNVSGHFPPHRVEGEKVVPPTSPSTSKNFWKKAKKISRRFRWREFNPVYLRFGYLVHFGPFFPLNYSFCMHFPKKCTIFSILYSFDLAIYGIKTFCVTSIYIYLRTREPNFWAYFGHFLVTGPRASEFIPMYRAAIFCGRAGPACVFGRLGRMANFTPFLHP